MVRTPQPSPRVSRKTRRSGRRQKRKWKWQRRGLCLSKRRGVAAARSNCKILCTVLPPNSPRLNCDRATGKHAQIARRPYSSQKRSICGPVGQAGPCIALRPCRQIRQCLSPLTGHAEQNTSCVRTGGVGRSKKFLTERADVGVDAVALPLTEASEIGICKPVPIPIDSMKIFESQVPRAVVDHGHCCQTSLYGQRVCYWGCVKGIDDNVNPSPHAFVVSGRNPVGNVRVRPVWRFALGAHAVPELALKENHLPSFPVPRTMSPSVCSAM